VHLLPAEPLARPASRAKDGFGSAWPVADVVIEGRQKWDVIPTGDKRPYTTISTDWMTVRVHDRPALEANTHAWAGMCALAIKHLPGNAPNYDRLLRNGYDRDFLQRYNREHPNEGRKFGR
jgi:hypothetical protein